MRTRVFRSGNSLAVRVPNELANMQAAEEVEIKRVGEALVIRPIRAEMLDDVIGIAAMFSPDFMAARREPVADGD